MTAFASKKPLIKSSINRGESKKKRANGRTYNNFLYLATISSPYRFCCHSKESASRENIAIGSQTSGFCINTFTALPSHLNSTQSKTSTKESWIKKVELGSAIPNKKAVTLGNISLHWRMAEPSRAEQQTEAVMNYPFYDDELNFGNQLTKE
nr:hypothetical protein [Candidatus Regiella insecticola]